MYKYPDDEINERCIFCDFALLDSSNINCAALKQGVFVTHQIVQ